MKKKYIIKDLTTLMYWGGYKEEGDMFDARIMNAKVFNNIRAAEKEIRVFSTTTGGCYLSHTALEIVQVFFTNQ